MWPAGGRANVQASGQIARSVLPAPAQRVAPASTWCLQAAKSARFISALPPLSTTRPLRVLRIESFACVCGTVFAVVNVAYCECYWHRQQKKTFTALVERLGGVVSEQPSQCTHLVMETGSGLVRTEKLLVALSRGKMQLLVLTCFCFVARVDSTHLCSSNYCRRRRRRCCAAMVSTGRLSHCLYEVA